jgi:hypothetical protein
MAQESAAITLSLDDQISRTIPATQRWFFDPPDLTGPLLAAREPAPTLRAAGVKLLKAKQVRQATAFKCFLFVALGGDFNKELGRCGRNGLCQGRGAASRKERAANLGNDLEGVYGPLVPWSSGIIHRCVQFVH